MTHLKDEELLNQRNSSDDAAFAKVYQRYWKPVRAFGLRMTGNDEVFVDDMVQDTFVSLHAVQKVHHAGTNLEGYLFTIMRNKVIDHLKKNKRNNKAIAHFAAFKNEFSDEADEQLIMKEFQALIIEGVDQMPEGMKQVFKMSEEQFLSRAEIAAALNRSEETVKNQLYKSRKLLRSMLKLVLTYYFVLLLNKILNIFL